MAPIKHGQLTKYQKAGSRCTGLKYDGDMCGAKTWQQCHECSEPICSRHIVGHYRKFHARSI